jgi:hypothetical protein
MNFPIILQEQAAGIFTTRESLYNCSNMNLEQEKADEADNSTSTLLLEQSVDKTLICPLTKATFIDPVIASDGFTYERLALEDYLRKSNRSPITKETLNPAIILPNHTIRLAIEKRRQKVNFDPKETLKQYTAKHFNQVNCQISSHLDEMDQLHQIHPWIPDSSCIRPTSETLERKQLYFATEISQYESETDFILNEMFCFRTEKNPDTGKLRVCCGPENAVVPHSLRVTRENRFPYNVPKGTLHFVHWVFPHYATSPMLNSAETSKIIDHQLREYFGDKSNFEFVWNINPKMSLPHERTCVMHAHVFVKVS